MNESIDDCFYATCDQNTFIHRIKKSLREISLAEGICPRCGLPREEGYAARCECDQDGEATDHAGLVCKGKMSKL